MARETVRDQQRLVRLGDVAHLFGLAHQLVIDVEAARRVEHDDVKAAEPSRLDGARCDLLRRLPFDDRQRIDPDLLAQDLQLLLRGRAARVERGHQHFELVALFQPFRDFGCRRGFARPLQADHHDGHGGWGVEVDGLRLGAERAHELVMHDLDDHLSGRDRADNLLADGLFANAIREGLHHVQRHVGLDQRTAHLAHRFGHIAVGERAAARQLVENAGKAVGERFEHGMAFRFVG